MLSWCKAKVVTRSPLLNTQPINSAFNYLLQRSIRRSLQESNNVCNLAICDKCIKWPIIRMRRCSIETAATVCVLLVCQLQTPYIHFQNKRKTPSAGKDDAFFIMTLKGKQSLTLIAHSQEGISNSVYHQCLTF